MDRPFLTVIGMMSGTSLDGIDAALIRTDGRRVSEVGPFRTRPYAPAFRERLRALLGRDPAGVAGAGAVVRELTLLHAEAARALMAEAGLGPDRVDLIGFHGQTVFHKPADGITIQVGDGALLAAETGVAVVDDFRADDVRAGGEGAPFAPLYHAALARDLEKPLAVLNLGGVGNVTWIGPGKDGGDDAMLAFDTGPANALLDDWAARTIGRPMDEGGRLARGGRADALLLAGLLCHPYFRRRPPKSLDRDEMATDQVARLSPADGAATLAGYTIGAVVRAQEHFPAPVRRWLVTGGGRHNGYLMEGLRAELDAPVDPVEAVGWQGDALEAQAFAFLAARSLAGLPLSLPGTTGVAAPQTGGVLHPA
ncbi:MAG: anhydro-N-acetylmuramic acid kinase [Hyphomicrobiales bacterium]|nr:anhydro-N-acetylmuramic acid kinase [Hyphomicrobiales bacterium]